MGDLSEGRLVEGAKGGDVAAYEALVREHQAVAFRVAFAITQDASDAEDATQEAFVKAYRALGRFRTGAPFRPWILAIVANEAKNSRKAAGRRARLALRASDEMPVSGAAAPANGPTEAVLAAERRAELLAAVGSLEEMDRVVIHARYWLGLSEKEAAAVLGCATGTVKSRLSRAVGRLREKMTTGVGGGDV